MRIHITSTPQAISLRVTRSEARSNQQRETARQRINRRLDFGLIERRLAFPFTT